MEKKTTYRILIFDDSEEIRSLLYEFFNRRGYEIFSFPNPGVCPISHEKICPCPIGEACSDFILSDLNMPVQQGIDFLEGQIRKGCQCKIYWIKAFKKTFWYYRYFRVDSKHRKNY